MQSLVIHAVTYACHVIAAVVVVAQCHVAALEDAAAVSRLWRQGTSGSAAASPGT